jgi:CheY-like chemotaxis protein
LPTVMVVDDDGDISECLDLILSDTGYTVLLADSAKRALELLRQGSAPAVVLFDYLMSRGTAFTCSALLPRMKSFSTGTPISAWPPAHGHNCLPSSTTS